MPIDLTFTIPQALRCPLLCPSPASSSSSSKGVVNTATVSEWLHKFNANFPKLERIANHGLYSLLDKQVKELTPLLEQGQKIASSQTQFAGVSQMVSQLVRPRLTQLQAGLASANQKLAGHSEEIKGDARLAKKWAKHGLPASVLENHADFARFLIESKLAFDIVGYRETSQNPNEHDVKLDPRDNHPMIKMQGRWVRWETISRELHYDPKDRRIKSRDYPGTLVQVWNYFHPQGLVPVDRINWDQAFPVYELSQEEYQRTRQQALKFYETNQEKDPGIPKDCIVQFSTIDHWNMPTKLFDKIPVGPLLDNAQRNYPVHISIRLITPDRKVYSFGIEMPPEEYDFIFSDYFSTFLATCNGKIGMRDYEEFRPDNRYVTSVPLTAQRAQNILARLNEIKEKQYRFQYMRQNCSPLMAEVLQMAGYEVVDMRTSVKDMIIDMFPSLTQIPLIKTISDCANKIWKGLPGLITKPIEFTADMLLYFPRKVGTIFTNFLVLKMGGAKKSTPLQDGVEDEEFYDKRKIQYFSSLIRSWTDIFSDEVNTVYHSKYFIDWQKDQRSTFYHTHIKGKPKMAIVPPR
jgi:hypothetical protein